MDPAGGEIQYLYDAASRVIRITELTGAGSIITSAGYDAAGNEVRTRNGKGVDTWTRYNSWGLPTLVVEPGTTSSTTIAERSWEYAYGAGGVLTSETKPGGITVTNHHDVLGRLNQQVGSTPGDTEASDTRHFEYSNASDLAEARSRACTRVSAGGPWVNSSIPQESPLAQRRSNTGTADASRPSSSTTTPPRTPTTQQEGSLRFMATRSPHLQCRSSATTGMTRTGARSTVGTRSRNSPGATTTYSYDAFGRTAQTSTTNTSGTVLRQTSYTYDAVDNIISKTTAGGVSDGGSYTYDLARRLQEWTPQATAEDPTPAAVSYTWDLNNNRTAEQSGNQSTTWTYDARDRPLTRATTNGGNTSTTAFSTDDRGAITEMSGATTATLAFDAFDQLINDNGQARTYDALGRLASTPPATSFTPAHPPTPRQFRPPHRPPLSTSRASPMGRPQPRRSAAFR